MRREFNEQELRSLLSNAHDIEVRLWIVDDGVFNGIVFDSPSADWKKMIVDPDAEKEDAD